MTIRILLACLSSLFVWVSFPGGAWPQVAFISLVPLGFSLLGSKVLSGFGYGLLFGFLSWIGVIWGFTHGITTLYGYSTITAWFWTGLICLFHATPYGIFGYLQARYQWMGNSYGALKSSVALTLLLVWYPNILPGYHVPGFYLFTHFIQILDLGGVPMLLFVVNLINFLIVDVMLLLSQRKKPVTHFVALITIIGLTLGYGTYRLDRIDQEMGQAKQDQWIQIASVQPNIPFNKHDLPPKERGNNLQSTIYLTQKVMHDNPETNLVVWPELPLIMVCQDESTQDIEDLVKAINCPLIYNCSRRAGEDQYYNAAVFLSPAGEPNFEYHKRLLFPFGEYLPFSRFFSFLGLTTPDFLKTAHGKTPSVFDMGLNQKIIPSLCYESVFSSPVRDAVRLGGNILINMTDDIWFGKSRVPIIHAALGMFRAIEYRIPMAIVTNSGDGFFVQPSGRILKNSQIPSFKKGAISKKVFTPEKRSPYFRIGDVFLWALTLCWVIIWAFSSVRIFFKKRPVVNFNQRRVRNEKNVC